MNITPAEDRIELALGNLASVTNKLSKVCLALQEDSNPSWGDLAKLEHALDDIMDMLENGY